MKLWTIGYQSIGLDAFLETLQRAKVQTVLDVRDLPLSRRAGFSKTPLSHALAESGMGYLHLKALGTPKEGRIANKQHQWKRFWSIVDRQLSSVEATAAMEHAARVAKKERCCLLCFERDVHVCHRLKVAEEMAARFGFSVEHLTVPQ